MDSKSELKNFEENIDSLKHFIERYLKLEKKFERPKSIFSVLKGPKEAKFQYVLEYFLDPKQSHGFKDAILKAFLDLVDVKDRDSFGDISSRVQSHHVELQTEVGIYGEEEDEGRIDLVLAGGPSSQKSPEWAIFVELKVGASEGEEQTKRYARARSWNFNWFGKNRLDVSDLNEYHYIYVRKERESQAASEDFTSISWKDLIDAFKNRIDRGIFDYPHRSVIQFLDFFCVL